MGIELGIGEMLLVKAIGESTGRSNAKIKEDLRKEGDLGKVAMVRAKGATRIGYPTDCQLSRNNQPTMFKPKPLTVPGVFKDLTEIAKASGNSVGLYGLVDYVMLTTSHKRRKWAS